MEWNSTLGDGISNETADPIQSFMFENYTERAIIAFLYCVVVAVGVVGNSLVILAVMFSNRLRSSTNWFVINLAFADLLTCLSLPFGVTALLSRDGWLLPGWVCAMAAAIGFVCIGVSVITLALIAYNRWYLLSQPRVKYKQFYCIRNISIMLGIAWLYSLLLVLAPHVAGLGRLGYSPRYKICWHDTTVPTSDYYSLMAGPGLIIPFAIAIIAVYIRIYVFVSKHNKTMRKTVRCTMSSSVSETPSNFNVLVASSKQPISKEQSGTGSQNGTHLYEKKQQRGNVDSVCSDLGTVTDTPSDMEEHSTKEPKRSSCRRSNKKSRSRLYQHHVSVTKRLSVVVLAFFVCLLPFGISSVVPHSEPAIPWTGLMTTFNSCINPFIYAWTMPVFRRVMGHIICCRLRSIPNPSRLIRPSV